MAERNTARCDTSAVKPGVLCFVWRSSLRFAFDFQSLCSNLYFQSSSSEVRQAVSRTVEERLKYLLSTPAPHQGSLQGTGVGGTTPTNTPASHLTTPASRRTTPGGQVNGGFVSTVHHSTPGM